jgi:hypothetical protein
MTKTGGSRPRPDKVAESRHPGQAGGGPGIARRIIEQSTVPENVTVSVDFPETLPPPSGRPAPDAAGVAEPHQQRRPGDAGRRQVADRRQERSMFAVRRCFLQIAHIERRTSNVESNGDFIEISVADTGEGIAPESMEKLFQPLFSTKSRGVGLGLPICKNFVEANGGRIEVVSRLGKGTTFTVALPVEGGEHGT